MLSLPSNHGDFELAGVDGSERGQICFLRGHPGYITRGGVWRLQGGAGEHKARPEL